ncbi:MAG TPA: NAD(P)/FAD-dependent oxidoreductase [Galbitalea sp.]|jgi:thioredoxin reductase (NADPH)
MTTNRHDVMIIGAGAAGLSAGLVLARAQADVLLIDSGHQRNAPAAAIHGFVSRDGISPVAFYETARREVTEYGGAIVLNSISAIRRRGTDFVATLRDGTVETSRALLIATGLVDELPLIPGVRDRWGTRVHHCPYCHGHEVLGQTIVVVGGRARELSIKQAGLLRRYSDDVTLITNGIVLAEAELNRLEAFGVRVIAGAVSHLVGEPGTLSGVALGDGTILPADAVFVAPSQRQNDELLRSLGCQLDAQTGLVSVDSVGQTSVAGVWAAGNVVTPTAQVVTAAGAGSASAIAINGWLLQLDLDTASAGRP